jgi:hypothetical protein
MALMLLLVSFWQVVYPHDVRQWSICRKPP